jgi:hypothetical protein
LPPCVAACGGECRPSGAAVIGGRGCARRGQRLRRVGKRHCTHPSSLLIHDHPHQRSQNSVSALVNAGVAGGHSCGRIRGPAGAPGPQACLSAPHSHARAPAAMIATTCGDW